VSQCNPYISQTEAANQRYRLEAAAKQQAAAEHASARTGFKAGVAALIAQSYPDLRPEELPRAEQEAAAEIVLAARDNAVDWLRARCEIYSFPARAMNANAQEAQHFRRYYAALTVQDFEKQTGFEDPDAWVEHVEQLALELYGIPGLAAQDLELLDSDDPVPGIAPDVDPERAERLTDAGTREVATVTGGASVALPEPCEAPSDTGTVAVNFERTERRLLSGEIGEQPGRLVGRPKSSGPFPSDPQRANTIKDIRHDADVAPGTCKENPWCPARRHVGSSHKLWNERVKRAERVLQQTGSRAKACEAAKGANGKPISMPTLRQWFKWLAAIDSQSGVSPR
jgi:hypothetical protein